MERLLRLVALLTEGVDRNLARGHRGDGGPEVALLTEGVDRNTFKIEEG